MSSATYEEIDWDKYGEALGKASEQGEAHIGDNKGKVAIFDISRGFNNAAAVNQEARDLEAALRRDVKHIGPSYGDALVVAFGRARARNGIQVSFTNKEGSSVNALPAGALNPKAAPNSVLMTLAF